LGRAPDELTTQESFDLVDQIAGLANPILVLSGGEPLYRDDIFEIAEHASAQGLRVALATNGTLVDEKVADQIKAAGIQRVSISVDGVTRESHDSFRGVTGAFDASLEGGRLVKSRGVELQINTTVTQHNVDELKAILELAEREKVIALHFFLLVPVGCGLEISEQQQITGEDYEHVLNWIYDASRRSSIEMRATCAPHYYRVIRQRAREEGRKITTKTDGMAAMTRGCLAGSGVCFVSYKGEVFPCGYFPVAAGDTRTTSFADIWQNSSLFHELRDPGLLEGKCGLCEYKMVCAGCRARAYGETGNYLAEEPFCAYEPRASQEIQTVQE
jgi:heme b synthase